jgi:hypothetical protein
MGGLLGGGDATGQYLAFIYAYTKLDRHSRLKPA